MCHTLQRAGSSSSSLEVLCLEQSKGSTRIVDRAKEENRSKMTTKSRFLVFLFLFKFISGKPQNPSQECSFDSVCVGLDDCECTLAESIDVAAKVRSFISDCIGQTPQCSKGVSN